MTLWLIPTLLDIYLLRIYRYRKRADALFLTYPITN